MINEIKRENMNNKHTDHQRSCLLIPNTRIFDLYIRKLGKKRTFKEMDAYNQENIERGFSSLTINKRFKLNKHNQYLPVGYTVPLEKFSNKSQIDHKLIQDESEEFSGLDEFDIDKEKKMVEAFYSKKNQLLSKLMFGDYISENDE